MAPPAQPSRKTKVIAVSKASKQAHTRRMTVVARIDIPTSSRALSPLIIIILFIGVCSGNILSGGEVPNSILYTVVGAVVRCSQVGGLIVAVLPPSAYRADLLTLITRGEYGV